MHVFLLGSVFPSLCLASDHFSKQSTFSHQHIRFVKLHHTFRLDFRRPLVSGLRTSDPRKETSGEERGLLSRTAASNRAYHTSVVENQHLVIIQDGVQSMSNSNDCGILKLVTNDFLDQTVSLQFHISGGFIHDDDLALLDQCTSQAHQLPLTDA